MTISQRLPVVAIALGAGALTLTSCHGDNQSAAPAAAASSTPATSLLAPSATAPALPVDERAACIILVPTAHESADIVIALSQHPDASTVDRDQVTKTIGHLRAAFELAPDQLRADIRTQVATLEEIDSVLAGNGNRTLHLDDFRATGRHIAERCAPYATR